MKAPSSDETGAALMQLLDLFADRVAVRCVALLGGVTDAATYTSKSPPKGMSRKRFNEICRGLVDGGDERPLKRGHGWVVPVEAIDRAPRPRRKLRSESGVAETEYSVDGALAEAGIRSQQK